MPAINPSQRQTAVVAAGLGAYAIAHDHPIPSISPDQIIIRTAAVAINPVDVNTVDNFAYTDTAAGFDLAGIVIAIGSAVDLAVQLREGDRVCAAVQGMNPLRPTDGAFAQYVAADADLVMKVPSDMPLEEAASLPVGVGTIGLALRSLGLDTAGQKPAVVLVYGASSASGTLALQMLRHAGHHAIATCSPANFNLVKEKGAEAVFDYRSPTCVADIRGHTRNSLRYVLDCISETSSMEFCYATIGRAGGLYTSLAVCSSRVKATRPTVKADWVFHPALFGREVAWPNPYNRVADPNMRETARELYGEAQLLLDQGLLRPHPIEVQEGGFPAILDAIQRVRQKDVSGVKLVCAIPHQE
ncbi:zinc-binding alcohol dehydrogenase family protein [Aspergillus ibericus CBS 121593]|uniref:GroES-like protein n=1 Tax=Aspergillus ibericus CBS 121593 TaxID=1448316 RepID=A0A395GRD9_9EURO|nr:GroES-like protein [Aspergillus ibericus CBS 121593]RAK98121.1 GroES-like protein [Aspergillus ibericus CBS 121593]